MALVKCSRRLCRLISAAALVLVITRPALGAASQTFNPLDWLRAVKVLPSTEAIATRQGFLLEGIPTGSADALPQAGDQVTALVELKTFDHKLPTTQWIIRMRLEGKMAADAPGGRSNAITDYVNTGAEYTFRSDRTGMNLETVGPITSKTRPDAKLAVRHQEIQVATDFLRLDLNRAAGVVRRVTGEDNRKVGLSLNFGPRPFSTDEVKVQRQRALALHLTEEDLRSICGSLPALMQFLTIARSTPELQGILYQVLDKPSVIDVLRSGANDSVHFDFLGGGPSSGQEIFWPEAKHEDFGVLALNLVIFNKPVLTVVLYVTTPRPPLLVSAGIVGLAAFKPKPDMADRFVVIRVLSATAKTTGTAPFAGR